jgi:hypothetical protein
MENILILLPTCMPCHANIWMRLALQATIAEKVWLPGYVISTEYSLTHWIEIKKCVLRNSINFFTKQKCN